MFREDKTTQMAASFLRLAGRKIKYINLIKMMYIADKAMMLRRGIPITFDKWVSMEKGPVLSITLNLIRGMPSPGYTSTGYWATHIKTHSVYAVMDCDPGDDNLSRAEEREIAETYAKWGTKGWAVVDATHDFPEWENPAGGVVGSIPIDYGKAVILNGGTPEAAEAVRNNLALQHHLQGMAARG